MSETKRSELIGKVVSAKNDKTITVLVETYRKQIGRASCRERV